MIFNYNSKHGAEYYGIGQVFNFTYGEPPIISEEFLFLTLSQEYLLNIALTQERGLHISLSQEVS